MQKAIELFLIWFFLSILIVISANEKRISKKAQKKIVLSLILLVSIFNCTRTIGLDLRGYERIYKQLSSMYNGFVSFNSLFTQSYELGMQVLANITSKLGIGYKGFMFICAFIPQLIVYYCIKNRQQLLTPYCIFMMLNMFSIDITRQFFADSIFLLSMVIPVGVISTILCLLTGLFHYSGFIAILHIPVKKVEYKLFAFFVIISVAVAGFFSWNRILLLLNEKYPGNSVINKIALYTIYNTEYYQYYNSIHFFMKALWSTFMIITVFCFLIRNYNYLHICVTNKKLLTAQKMGFIISIPILLVLQSYTFSDRVFMVFNIGFFLILSDYIENKKRRSTRQKIYLWLISYNLIATLYYIGTYSGWRFFYDI